MTGGAAFLRNLVVLLALSVCIGCLVPEEFDATIDVRRDGAFRFTYDGLVTEALSRAAAIRGELKPNDETSLVRQVTGDAAKDPRVRSIRYLGHQQFRVSYADTGRLDRPFYFLSMDYLIFSIVPKNNGTVEIAGFKLDEKGIRQLEQLQIKINGVLRVSTDVDVVTHNASTIPRLWGLVGSYRWTIRSSRDPAPLMVLRTSPRGE
jgi:hypothetical protein